MRRLIRRVEQRLMEEYPHGEMRCPAHFCLGQETAPAALSTCLKVDDVLSTHYRSHGYYLAKGGSLDGLIAEMMGKATGCNGGIAGSMELADDRVRFSSGAIVGGSIATALGAAFAFKYREEKQRIAVTVFGDGTMDEGVTYEAMNLAELHQLPILFLCENNGTAADAPNPKRMGQDDIPTRARAFMSSVASFSDSHPPSLQGNLAVAVYKVRKGEGPAFVEVRTRRDAPHVGIGDPAPTFLPGGDPVIEAMIEQAFAKARAAHRPVLNDLLPLNYSHTRERWLPIIEAPGSFVPKQAESTVRAF